MRLVPVGVDPELFRPRPESPRVPGRLITTASADVALKGLAYLLEAIGQAAHRARRHADDHRQAEGRQEHRPDRLARPQRRTSSSCRASPTSAIVELYAEAELAVVPSLYEGFSLPAIEAMVTGTALVATDGGALPEVTGRDGETVLPCRGGRRRGAGGDDRPRPRRPRAAGPRRCRRAPARRSIAGRGGAAPSSPSSSTARCWRCRRTSTSPRRNAAPGTLMLTIRFDRLAALGLRPGSRVLDVGSGFGRHAYELARRGHARRRPRSRRRRGRSGRATRSRRWSRRARSPPAGSPACCAATPPGCRSPTTRSTP